jgi:hypothetical protein
VSPRAAALALLCAIGVAGCRSREARQIEEAVESFIDFGMSNEERVKSLRDDSAKRPHLHERSRKVDLDVAGGPRLEVELDLPHQTAADAVEEALTIELDRLDDEEPYPWIRIVGRPAGLIVHGGTMGIATSKRRDGRVETKVQAMVRDDQPALTEAQYEALVDLELALARGPASKARTEIAGRHGAAVLDEARRVAKRRYGAR